jgi:hypothetical protein
MPGKSGVWGNCIFHAKPQRTRRGLNSVTEESSLSDGTKKPSKILFFAFFA